jgi:3-phenylpropionate/trans-cinnamate dioxygenase ferredoxin subunit
MQDWFYVTEVADIPPGSWQVVDINDISILIFNINGQFYAIQNLCTHDGGDLAGGRLEGDEIICPRHGAHFCVKTGAATQPPAYEDVPAFPVRVIGDKIQVKAESWNF